MTPNASDALAGRLIAVLNTGSGSCEPGSAGRMAAIFAEAGLAHAQIVSVGPEQIDEALDAAVAQAQAVVVLGGDGTIGAAAEKCGAAGKLLIPLPGGTMNMLPHALYGEAGWEAVLARVLANPAVRAVSGGTAAGRPFFCAAIIGAPSLWADAREAVRRGDLAQFIARAVWAIRRHAEVVSYQIGEEAMGEAEAVAVICPLVSKALDDEERALEAAALDRTTAGDMFRLAFHAIFTDWRSDPSVSLARAKAIRVTGRGRVPVILDGETARMGRTVEIAFVPLAFHAIVAEQAIG